MAEYAFGAGEMVNRLLTLVVGEIGLVVGVNEEVKKLGTVLRGIQAVLQDAQKKQVEQLAVRHWLHQLKEVAYDAEDVLDDVDYKELKFTISKKKLPRWFNPKRGNARRKIAHKIKAIKKRLAEIYDNMKMLQLVPLESNPQSGSAGYAVVDDRETYSYIKDSIVFGREDDKKEIIQKLIKDDGSSSSSSSSTDGHQENPSSGVGNTLPVISIVGLGGLGKTTLASLVYNDHAVTKHFELRVWICVSTHFRTANLFYQLLQQINRGNALPESSSKQILLDDLKTQLERQGMKKLLLVLDDDWNEDLAKWEDFVLPWGRFVSTGSKIIVTSRNREVASVTRSQLRIELKGLSNESCWDLLRRHAFPPEGPRKITPNLVDIGKKISSKCKGVPLAAKVIGSLLQSKKEEWEWLAVQNDEVWSLDEDNQIMKVLKFSYDDLSPVLQACFSYCAIFPKDFWIKKEELIHLWMAQGLLGASSSQCERTLELYKKKKKTLEDVGMKCFDTLYSKSFFQDARRDEYGVVASCKMHHFLHDLAQSIRGSECQVLGESSVTSTDLSRCRHVSMISLSTIEALQHEAKKVRTIFGWESTSKKLDDGGTLEVPRSSALFKFESLRVLDLSGLRGSDFSSISYKYLKHLRYLDLSCTSIKSLPKWVTRLYHLQTLKLIKCGKLTELREDLIKLKKLRHLFIDDHKKWKKMAQALGELHQLQTLPLFVACQEDGGCGISVLKNLNDLRGELEIHRLSLVKKANLAKEGILSKKSSLRKLRLHWNRPSSVGGGGGGGGGGDELLVLEVLRPHTNLQRLSIEGFGGVKFPAWVSSGSDLPNLVRLKLSNCNHCEHIPSFGGLHRLKELELRSMANLKEWLEGGGVMFPCLEKLLIKDCPNLNKTPEHVFPSLKSLELKNVGGMGVVSITSSSLTSLTSLTITNCEDLEYLQEGLVSNNSQLNVVVISNCPKLKAFREEGSASASAADEILPNRFLCELVIDNSSFSYAREGFFKILKCPELESIGKEFLSSLVFLKRFRVDGYSKLKHIELSQSFKHLRELQITYCPNFEGFAHHSLRRSEQEEEEEEVLPCCCHTLKISYCDAISSIDLRRFSSLRDLQITDCVGLQALQGLPFLTALQNLEIDECPAISSIDLSTLPSLRKLYIYDCPEISSIDLPTLPSLHKLYIYDCPEISSIDLSTLPSLHELTVIDCGKLQVLQGFQFLTALQELLLGPFSKELNDFPLTISANDDDASSLQSNNRLILPCLRKLRIHGWAALQSLPRHLQRFTTLKALHIQNFSKLTELPEWLGNLTSLEELSIKECKNLSHLPSKEQMQRLTLLQKLVIDHCPGLKESCSRDGEEWPNISHFPEIRIDWTWQHK